jgi:hypothetical protein
LVSSCSEDFLVFSEDFLFPFLSLSLDPFEESLFFLLFLEELVSPSSVFVEFLKKKKFKDYKI